MKKHLLICALALMLVLTLGMLSGCDLPFDLPFGDNGDNAGDEWKPSGKSVAIIKKGAPVNYFVIYGTPTEITSDAANTFKEAVRQTKLATINSAFGSAQVTEEK